MAAKRAKARDLLIPIPANVQRRLQAESNPELWLTTYFSDVFYEAFTADRSDMLRAMIEAALYGGDQAIAGSRGEGKTTLVMLGTLGLMCNRLCDFPVVIGKSQSKSQLELKDIREKLQQSKLFIADYPEIGVPFQAVGGWSSRARMQTVKGEPTNIVIAADHLAFPTITLEQLPKNWPKEITPASCGQVMYCLGIDGPIRGTKFRGRRPKLAIIDDIEDREAAASDTLIAKNEEIIEQDIAGLGASGERIARVMPCTIQNRKCIAYKYTDPKLKPSWRGRRYRKMLQPPTRMDLVQQYIEMRQDRKTEDPDAREAFRFWRDNQEEIERDARISNKSSYSKKLHSDGELLELSAIQAYYNRVADWGEKAVATEIDNDPPETAGPQSQGLTAEVVASRDSGLPKHKLPMNTVTLTAAIDLGKYFCHWVVIAWWDGAGGVVVDYGFESVLGTDRQMDNEASEPLIYQTLLNWRDKVTQTLYTDATGINRRVDKIFVDSGTFTNAAYEFCRQSRGPFYCSKGQNPYHKKTKDTDTIKAGSNLYAAKQDNEDIWLYHLDTNYWKQFIHERLLTPTFDENGNLRRGSLSLYHSEKSGHRLFCQHIVAEQLLREFIQGKGEKVYWDKVHEDNHWLDAVYMAAAAAESMGIKLFSASEITIEAQQRQASKPKVRPSVPANQRFRQRPGGWMGGIKKR